MSKARCFHRVDLNYESLGFVRESNFTAIGVANDDMPFTEVQCLFDAEAAHDGYVAKFVVHDPAHTLQGFAYRVVAGAGFGECRLDAFKECA